MSVVVNLATATICFLGQCFPALVGDSTLPGTYQLIQRYTLSEGYGGNVLKYDETPDLVMSIHRVYTRNPRQRRLERLRSDNPEDRKFITDGCINVDPAVYDLLWECCSRSTLTIEPGK